MKKAIIILLLLITPFVRGQDRLTVSLTQDIKLGLGADKKHGNVKPTLDFIANVNMEGKQRDFYYHSIQMQYERANLSSGYFSRYSINSMWTANFKFLPKKLKTGFGIGLGVIEREGSGSNLSYSYTIDFIYPITKRIGILQKNEFVRRSDLETPKTGVNVSIGLIFK